MSRLNHILFIFALCLFFSCPLTAQNNSDSLKKLIANGKNDSAKVKNLVRLALVTAADNAEAAMGVAIQALNLSREIRWKKGEAFSYDAVGLIYRQMGEYDHALEFGKKALDIRLEAKDTMGLIESYNNMAAASQLNSDNAETMKYNQLCLKLAKAKKQQGYIGNALGNMGSVYLNLGDYPQALEHYLAALKIFEDMKSDRGIAVCLGNIGVLYYYLKDFDRALEYQTRSQAIEYRLGNKEGIAASLGNIGGLYGLKRDFEKALEYHRKSHWLYNKLGNKRSENIEELSIGNLYLDIADSLKKSTGTKQDDLYQKAISSFTKCIRALSETGDRSTLSHAYCSLGMAYAQTGKDKQAEEMMKKSLDLAVNAGSRENELRTCGQLSELYGKRKNYEKALAYTRRMMQLKEDISGEEIKSKMDQRELRYEFNKKMSADSLRFMAEQERKDMQLKTQEMELKQERTLQYMLAGGIGLIALFSAFIFNRFKVTRKQNKVIEEQKLVVEEKNKDILDSISYARNIQSAILPAPEQVKKMLPESFILYRPKDIVSGDFYFTGSPTNHTGKKLVVVSVADCTGHGVPGAFLTLLGKTFLQLGLTEKSVNTCSEALGYLDKGLSEMLNKTTTGSSVNDGMDISLCAFDFENSNLQFAGAKNPVYIVREKDLTELKGDKRAIGELAHGPRQDFTDRNFSIRKGDMVYLFSDGYADQFGGPDQKKFKSANLKKLLISISHESPEKQKQLLEQEFDKWKGELAQVDDICILGIRV